MDWDVVGGGGRDGGAVEVEALIEMFVAVVTIIMLMMMMKVVSLVLFVIVVGVMLMAKLLVLGMTMFWVLLLG